MNHDDWTVTHGRVRYERPDGSTSLTAPHLTPVRFKQQEDGTYLIEASHGKGPASGEERWVIVHGTEGALAAEPA